MSVVSFEFLGFLAALAVVYYILPMRVRKWALLAGSAAFWLLCGWQGAAYLTAETLLIWGCARLMGRFSERRGVCRALLVGGMVTVFGAMVLMKALSQMEALPDGLLVPIGLSYFTFQSVGYLIDVYRGKVTPEKNYAKVLLFAGFFPQMTQGPITTWKQLMPQLDSPHRLSPNGFVSGVFLMAWGFFKKLVIADRLMPAVSVLVATAQELPGWLVLATAAMYAIVLYADFSGGIDIIRGAAELLGIDLPENFRRPFFAASIADYWRRWHISLGVWFRTYLLYPLVANQWNSYRQSRLISTYEGQVSDLENGDGIDYEAEWERARAYNASLLPSILPDSFAIAQASDEPDSEYMASLNLTGDGMMGTIEIPKIQVKLPIYHTTEATVLEKAAGHLEGSSLPIGGENSHAVISAHRGLPSASLFTDLDKLELGDHFLIHVLDETLAYEVDDIQVVEPEDTESLAVEPDEDLVTLLTCTPYGVNSHRLLVQGHRVSYDPETTIAKEETKGQVSMHTNYLLWVIVGLAVTAAFIAGLFLWDRKQKKKMENTATPKE